MQTARGDGCSAGKTNSPIGGSEGEHPFSNNGAQISYPGKMHDPASVIKKQEAWEKVIGSFNALYPLICTQEKNKNEDTWIDKYTHRRRE